MGTRWDLLLTQPPPYGGECHHDGDELLVLLSGAVDIILEHPAGTETVQVVAPQAFVMPRGTWHRLVPHGLAELLFMTPGPNNEHRPAER
jgi:mannose-6-phosphate isomerase-like protein (cupin superfamily)